MHLINWKNVFEKILWKCFFWKIKICFFKFVFLNCFFSTKIKNWIFQFCFFPQQNANFVFFHLCHKIIRFPPKKKKYHFIFIGKFLINLFDQLLFFWILFLQFLFLDYCTVNIFSFCPDLTRPKKYILPTFEHFDETWKPKGFPWSHFFLFL